ncbi:MAG: RNA methyltransferase [Hyphomicrobiaceae bacterium]|nr:RNA methyltransferase [Hyphomicrobiaceae bacterium]
MVARAMGNFGLDDLRIINPRDGWPNEKSRAVASGAAAIIDNATLYDTLNTAVSDLNWVAATTARQRDLRKPIMTPREVSDRLHERTLHHERCGILFGRERNGLKSDEIAIADAIVMIPVNNCFASLNLAQSVLLLAYEWLRGSGSGSLGRVTPFERPVGSGMNFGSSRTATKTELLGLFEHLENELELSGFFRPSHSRHVMVRNIRTMLTRMNGTDQEIRTMRGIVAALTRRK